MYEFVEGGPACEGCITTNEYRYYIRDGKTIRSLKNASEQPCRKCAFGPDARQHTLLKAKTQEQVRRLLCR